MVQPECHHCTLCSNVTVEVQLFPFLSGFFCRHSVFHILIFILLNNIKSTVNILNPNLRRSPSSSIATSTATTASAAMVAAAAAHPGFNTYQAGVVDAATAAAAAANGQWTADGENLMDRISK